MRTGDRAGKQTDGLTNKRADRWAGSRRAGWKLRRRNERLDICIHKLTTPLPWALTHDVWSCAATLPGGRTNTGVGVTACTRIHTATHIRPHTPTHTLAQTPPHTDSSQQAGRSSTKQPEVAIEINRAPNKRQLSYSCHPPLSAPVWSSPRSMVVPTASVWKEKSIHSNICRETAS